MFIINSLCVVITLKPSLKVINTPTESLVSKADVYVHLVSTFTVQNSFWIPIERVIYITLNVPIETQLRTKRKETPLSLFNIADTLNLKTPSINKIEVEKGQNFVKN